MAHQCGARLMDPRERWGAPQYDTPSTKVIGSIVRGVIDAILSFEEYMALIAVWNRYTASTTHVPLWRNVSGPPNLKAKTHAARWSGDYPRQPG